MLFRPGLPNSQKLYWPLIIVLMTVFLISVDVIQTCYVQTDFFRFFPYWTAAFFSFICLLHFDVKLRYLVVLGIMARISLIGLFPNLSDDVYRFYWDGRLIVEGINPYGVLPAEILKANLPYLDQTIFDKLNSPQYYTIYPPVNQLLFGIGACFGTLSNFVIVSKLLILCIELAGLKYMTKILEKINLDKRFSMLYFLNPLVIIEGTGNLHFEVVVVSLLCISLYYIFFRGKAMGAFLFALSIGVKLLPLMLLPYFLYSLKGRERKLYFTVLIISLALIFIPVAGSTMVYSFFNSVDLYFRKFEFNASIYYILRYVGQQITGYNLIRYIGPALGICTVLYNFYTAGRLKEFGLKTFARYALYVWTIYLLLATTVHPWYIIMLVFFSVLEGLTYPIIWSYLVVLTYVNYSGSIYHENLWFVSLEYFVLFAFVLSGHRFSRIYTIPWKVVE